MYYLVNLVRKWSEEKVNGKLWWNATFKTLNMIVRNTNTVYNKLKIIIKQ